MKVFSESETCLFLFKNYVIMLTHAWKHTGEHEGFGKERGEYSSVVFKSDSMWFSAIVYIAAVAAVLEFSWWDVFPCFCCCTMFSYEHDAPGKRQSKLVGATTHEGVGWSASWRSKFLYWKREKIRRKSVNPWSDVFCNGSDGNISLVMMPIFKSFKCGVFGLEWGWVSSCWQQCLGFTAQVNEYTVYLVYLVYLVGVYFEIL